MSDLKKYILFIFLIIGMSCELSAQSQNNVVTIKGTVKDNIGPVVGATIVAKNQPGLGIVSDIDGNFTIKVGPYDVLQISFVG